MREDTQGALSHPWEQGWRTVDDEVLERGERHTSAVWRLPRPISRVVAWWCDGAAVPASAFRRSREGRGEADR